MSVLRAISPGVLPVRALFTFLAKRPVTTPGCVLCTCIILVWFNCRPNLVIVEVMNINL